MNGVQEVLAGVLTEHGAIGFSCACGWREESAFYYSAHNAHVAAEQVKALREWAQQDETVEAGVSVFVNEGLIPEDMSYAEVVETVLTAVFGSDA